VKVQFAKNIGALKMFDLIFFDKKNIARFFEEHEDRLLAVLRFKDFLKQCEKKLNDQCHCEIRRQGENFWLPLKDVCGCGWIIK
jgi:hypothetical protein